MPLSSELVGQSTVPVVHEVDARWTMAYAAALGDVLPCYMDTRRTQGVVAHPLFAVCVEWPAVLAARTLHGDEELAAAERVRAVHATHDLHIARLIRPGDRLTTRLTIAGVERRRPGALQTMRLETTDADGAPVCTTWMGALYRDVDVTGPDRAPSDAPTAPAPIDRSTPARSTRRVPITANAAHVYTECARIWNPIHTDAAFAAAAGLPGIILHGTATLALALSCIIAAEAGGSPGRIRRIAGRFGAMVFLPSEITVRVGSRVATAAGADVRFEVCNGNGDTVVRDGLVVLDT
jgi:acyl dehydratase